MLHFVDGAATADTQCVQLTYPSVTYSTAPGVGDLRVDLGGFSGPTCVLGADPADPPSGLLGFGKAENGEFFLSTGYVGWRFREIDWAGRLRSSRSGGRAPADRSLRRLSGE